MLLGIVNGRKNEGDEEKRRGAKSIFCRRRITHKKKMKGKDARVSEPDKIFGKRLKSLIAMRERTRGCLVM